MWRVCNGMVHKEQLGVLLLLPGVLVPEVAGATMPGIAVEVYGRKYV